MIEVKDISKSFSGQKVIRNISTTFEKLGANVFGGMNELSSILNLN